MLWGHAGERFGFHKAMNFYSGGRLAGTRIYDENGIGFLGLQYREALGKAAALTQLLQHWNCLSLFEIENCGVSING